MSAGVNIFGVFANTDLSGWTTTDAFVAPIQVASNTVTVDAPLTFIPPSDRRANWGNNPCRIGDHVLVLLGGNAYGYGGYVSFGKDGSLERPFESLGVVYPENYNFYSMTPPNRLDGDRLLLYDANPGWYRPHFHLFSVSTGSSGVELTLLESLQFVMAGNGQVGTLTDSGFVTQIAPTRWIVMGAGWDDAAYDFTRTFATLVDTSDDTISVVDSLDCVEAWSAAAPESPNTYDIRGFDWNGEAWFFHSALGEDLSDNWWTCYRVREDAPGSLAMDQANVFSGSSPRTVTPMLGATPDEGLVIYVTGWNSSSQSLQVGYATQVEKSGGLVTSGTTYDVTSVVLAEYPELDRFDGFAGAVPVGGSTWLFGYSMGNSTGDDSQRIVLALIDMVDGSLLDTALADPSGDQRTDFYFTTENGSLLPQSFWMWAKKSVVPPLRLIQRDDVRPS